MMANSGQWQLIVVALIVVGVVGIVIWWAAAGERGDGRGGARGGVSAGDRF